MESQAGTAQPADLGRVGDALEQMALSYAPVIDRNHAVMATRLTVHTLQAEELPDIRKLVSSISHAWPAARGHQVLLNVTSVLLVKELLETRPAANILIEIPESLAMQADQADPIKRLHETGCTLLAHDYGALELPPEIQPCFDYVVSGLTSATDDNRRRAESGWTPGLICLDVRTLDIMKTCFDQGAAAITGWPMATPAQAARFQNLRTRTSMDVLINAVRLVNQEKTLEEVARAVAGDPTLAYRLLRYVNSVSFNLPTRIGTVADAITFLGYDKFKRWLIFMLTAVGHRTALRPTTFAAVRRGLMLEKMARMRGDADAASELFVCGILSLIDRMLGRPMAELLQAIHASNAISAALARNTGPYLPYLEMVRSLEAGLIYPIYEAAEKLTLGMGEVNQALLASTAAAFDMEQPTTR